MGGRLLGRSGGHLVGGNLLWLAFEQLAKILILQDRIHDIPLPERAPEKRSQDLTDIFVILEEAKRIRPHHETAPILTELAVGYPDLDLAPYTSTVDKLQQFFSMRYYKDAGHTFSRQEIDVIDSLYFLLRDRVILDIGMGKVDTLLLRQRNGKLEPCSQFEADLFAQNKALRPRPGCATHAKFRMVWAGPGMRVAETLTFAGGTDNSVVRVAGGSHWRLASVAVVKGQKTGQKTRHSTF